MSHNPITGAIPMAEFFAAGHLISSGGPRKTVGGVDYDSSSQRHTRYAGAHDLKPSGPLIGLRTVAAWPQMSLGLRATYPLLDINSQVFARRQTTGPNFGNAAQNKMQLIAGQYAIMPKIRG